MHTISQMTLLTVLLLMLTACADCTRDPSQAGFFCGIKNISEGTYGQRQVALRREAEQADALARQRAGQVRALQSQEASLAAEKKDLQTRLASLQTDLDRQKSQLTQARLQQQADRDRLAELETRRRALQKKRDMLASDNVSPQEIEELRREIQLLQDTINEILNLTVVE